MGSSPDGKLFFGITLSTEEGDDLPAALKKALIALEEEDEDILLVLL